MLKQGWHASRTCNAPHGRMPVAGRNGVTEAMLRIFTRLFEPSCMPGKASLNSFSGLAAQACSGFPGCMAVDTASAHAGTARL